MGKTIHRLGIGLAALAGAATAQATPVDQEVSIDGGKAPLHGSLLPGGRAKGPAVLIIAGSGPTDRDGNSAMGVKAATLKLLAEAFARAGITSLRTDKRGVGQSAPAMVSESELRFDMMVDDAVAWGRYLAAQPGTNCLVLAGHSEGALIVALAAQKLEAEKVKLCGLLSLSGTGRTAPVILKDQLKTALPEALQAKAFPIIAELEQGRTVADTPPSLAALFRPSVQPYLISWFGKDPVRALAKVKAPVLVIQGGNDIQVGVEDARMLAAARPGIELLIVDGANHLLKQAPSDRAGNIATYADPALPLDKQIESAAVGFVERVGKTR